MELLAALTGQIPLEEIRQRAGVNGDQVKWYRKRQPRFRERELAAVAGRPHMRAGVGGLPPKYKKFLEELHSTEDRVGAAKAAGIIGGWPAVQAAMDDLPELKRAYQAWITEGVAKCEDALRRRGDTSSARAYLQAHDPRYRRQVPEGARRQRGVPTDDEELAAEKKEWTAKARPGRPAPPPPAEEPAALEAEPGDEEREPDA